MKRLLCTLFNTGIVLMILVPADATGQGTVAYSENFDTGTGGWTIGGYQPSWSHGIPTLSHITGNGTACFTTGDNGAAVNDPYSSCIPAPFPVANGNFYNCCERSFVESPVIDLTGVNSPLLMIDINVYCEQTYDGAKMQLSTNGGLTWQDIGSYNGSAYQQFPSSVNCREQNWYNRNTVNYLGSASAGCGSVNYSFGGSRSGWSGGCSQDASGSCTGSDNHGTNGWITASHCISAAAGKNNVKIRMAFGAGSQVYADGIAFDNVKIINAVPVPDFTWNLQPACLPGVSFTNNTDCAASWHWNFGHPGNGNTSQMENPVHQFPVAGSYTVTLTAVDFCGGESALSKQVIVTSNAPVAGNITHTGSGICESSTDSIIIPLSVTGTSPYTVSYTFNGVQESHPGLTGNPLIVTGLPPGLYENITITDAAGCDVPVASGITIPFNQDTIAVTTVNDTLIKIGQTARLKASANLPATFHWFPEELVDNPFEAETEASPQQTTVYTVIATGATGCTAQSAVTVVVEDKVKCNEYFVPASFTPNGDGKNERFRVYTHPEMQLENYSLKIYNRWGAVVFMTDQSNDEWEGASSPAGVYAVIAEFRCRNKSTSTYRGTVSLVR